MIIPTTYTRVLPDSTLLGGKNPTMKVKRQATNPAPPTIHTPAIPPGMRYARAVSGWL